VPPAYVDATYKTLPGTINNATHFQITALCKGCSFWAPFDADPAQLDPSGENYLAFAYSNSPVDEPNNLESTFAIHDRVGHWVHDFAPAKAAAFSTWAAGTPAGKDPEPTTASPSTTQLTSSSAPSTQVSTTLSTSVVSAAPSSSAAVPSSCDS
jgi:hypothetical protein